ncbi:MAG: threonine synthase [Acidobacteria bacterium]|nr:threonine synthase [Acidobacteriota bacterium]
MSFFSHLECSVPCGAPTLDPRGRHHLCSCGAPLLARYDLDKARGWSRDSLQGREPTMWRYRELMPLFDDEVPVTLGEGFTPLFHARSLGGVVGLDRLYVKDESLNPTNSFKARGQSAAITRARALGVKTIALPTAGNAGNAAAAYSAAAGLACEVFIPKDAKQPFVDECRLYGANVTLVDGLITDAGRMAAERGGPSGWYDVSTLKEPYRIEGKKTMAYELAEQLNWQWPDWIVYPTGGGTGMVGMWKAFDEIERLGWVNAGKRPRMVSVQAENCAPIVRAFQQGAEKAQPWEGAATIADGLRVPRAIGDFLILRAVRESGGTAVAVSDRSMVDGMLALGKHEGVSAAPEGGAALVAIQRLVSDGTIARHESVVLFNTGGALKYLDVLR